MLDFKDEILDISGQPDTNTRYRMRDNDGNILQDNIQFEVKTPVDQVGTELDKAFFQDYKFEAIAPVFHSEGGGVEPYGVKSGATVNKGDYVIAETVHTNTGVPNNVYFEEGEITTGSANTNWSIQRAHSIKLVIDGETYYVLAFLGTSSSNDAATLHLYKAENGNVVHKSIFTNGTYTFRFKLLKIDTAPNMFMLVQEYGNYSAVYVDFYKIQNDTITFVNSTLISKSRNYLMDSCAKVADNCYWLSFYDAPSSAYARLDIFFEISDVAQGAINQLHKGDTGTTYRYTDVAMLLDGTLCGQRALYGETFHSAIITINFDDYSVSSTATPSNYGASLYENMMYLEPKDDTYYVAVNDNTAVPSDFNVLKKMIIKPSTNTYTVLQAYGLPITSQNTTGTVINRPNHIVGEIGEHLIISENPNNELFTDAKTYPLHLILVPKDLSKASIDINKAYTIDSTLFNGNNVCWAIMVAPYQSLIFAYRGYDSDTTTSYYYIIPIVSVEREIRPIANVNEKILGIAGETVGSFDTPAREIIQVYEKKYNTT